MTTNGLSNGPPLDASGLSQIVNAVWYMSQTSGKGSATLSLNWSESGTALEGSILQGAGTGIGISPFSGANWQVATGSGSVATETVSSSFSSFSAFGVGLIGVVLADMISGFNAMVEGNLVKLNWEATTDSQSLFAIQRSSDGSVWYTIGNVKPSDEQIMKAYSFIDEDPKPGLNYYRLAIRSPAGNYAYSIVKAIQFSSGNPLSVYPNPARGMLNIIFPRPVSGKIEFINSVGERIKILEVSVAGQNITSIPVQNYPAGTYFLEFIAVDGSHQVLPVVIQK